MPSWLAGPLRELALGVPPVPAHGQQREWTEKMEWDGPWTWGEPTALFLWGPQYGCLSAEVTCFCLIFGVSHLLLPHPW